MEREVRRATSEAGIAFWTAIIAGTLLYLAWPFIAPMLPVVAD